MDIIKDIPGNVRLKEPIDYMGSSGPFQMMAGITTGLRVKEPTKWCEQWAPIAFGLTFTPMFKQMLK